VLAVGEHITQRTTAKLHRVNKQLRLSALTASEALAPVLISLRALLA
jgi:hypothetical protein